MREWNGVCGGGVAKSGEVGRGVTGIDHQCRNPQGRGGCVWEGGAPTATRPKQRGLGGLAAHLGGGFGLLLGALLLLESCPCQTGATLRNIKACLKREAT